VTVHTDRGVKPPPEKPEAEASLLGAMLMDGALYNEVARGRLGPADLSREQHRIVLAAIARVAERSEQVGFANVQSDLVAHEELDAIGGAQFLVGLMQNVPTVAHASSYAAIVERTALLRRLIGVANEIARLALTREESSAAVSDAPLPVHSLFLKAVGILRPVVAGQSNFTRENNVGVFRAE